MAAWKSNGAGMGGMLVICLCLLAPLAMAGSQPVQKQTAAGEDPVTFVYVPAGGVYWNDRKLMDLPVPLFLHYYFKRGIPMMITPVGGIQRAEWYLNGVLQFVDTEAPFEWTLVPAPAVPMFGHSVTMMVKAGDGVNEYVSENLTVYRLFL